jgi:hypothetical protein
VQAAAFFPSLAFDRWKMDGAQADAQQSAETTKETDD